MAWDPAVLRKYNSTGHFRLLNQVRSELKANPLVRPQEGQTVGEANRSRALQRATEGRGSSTGRAGGRRGSSSREAARSAPAMSSPAPVPAAAIEETDHGPFTVVPLLSDAEATAAGFRDRLNAIDLR
ncbi:MAG: hypothetical protein VKM98_01350 [Cyanobacteriota bacterium]|nr:hypothetical protein [Cyanobacteriota bacterium]